jgi:hypothetical protein
MELPWLAMVRVCTARPPTGSEAVMLLGATSIGVAELAALTPWES